MFSFRETHFWLVGIFDWEYARTQFLLSVSRNWYGFTLAGYRNEKYATDPALLQGQASIAKLKSAYNSLIIGSRRLGW